MMFQWLATNDAAMKFDGCALHHFWRPIFSDWSFGSGQTAVRYSGGASEDLHTL